MGWEPNFVNKYIYTRLEGHPGVRVRAPGKALLPNEVSYNPLEHKGHLLCPDVKCDARLHLNSGEKSRLGDSAPGHWPHFKANPKQVHHKDCQADIPELLNDFGHVDIDPTKGWRFHLNLGETPSAKFNRHASSLTGLNERGRATVLDPAIRARESRVVKTPHDLIKVMQEGDHARLRDSVVINHGGIFDWSDFFVRKGRLKSQAPMKRWIGLAQRLLVDADQPALIEFNIAAGSKPELYFGRERLKARLDTFYAKHPVTGRRITVIPSVQTSHKDLLSIGEEGGAYLVLSHPLMDRSSSNSDIYFMTIPLKRPEHVALSPLDDMALHIQPDTKNPPQQPAKVAWQGDLLGGVPTVAAPI